ncbi:SRPBCC family protein [Canibacter zhoujuaniae]|uniref:SRPBCC family protein n=1 Tax=Canibacter zhoujuaniae TaxID=2708343 RepID=UPI0014212A4D|nr:SRPBCC domain-containing protein [Canibacter zhoujuaniae]
MNTIAPVVVRETVAAPRAEVWCLLSDPEKAELWCPELTFTPGRENRVATDELYGTFDVWVDGHVFGWRWADKEGQQTAVLLTVRAMLDDTTVTITESAFAEGSEGEKRAAAATERWEQALQALAALDIADALAAQKSDEGAVVADVENSDHDEIAVLADVENESAPENVLIDEGGPIGIPEGELVTADAAGASMEAGPEGDVELAAEVAFEDEGGALAASDEEEPVSTDEDTVSAAEADEPVMTADADGFEAELKDAVDTADLDESDEIIETDAVSFFEELSMEDAVTDIPQPDHAETEVDSADAPEEDDRPKKRRWWQF